MSNHYEKKNQNWKRTFLSGFDTSGKNSQHCFTNSGNLTVKKTPSITENTTENINFKEVHVKKYCIVS